MDVIDLDRRALAQLAAGAALALPFAAFARSAGVAAMTEEERANVRVITLQHEAVGAGRLEEAASHFSDPTSNHGRVVPRKLILAIFTDIKGTFSDWSLPVEAVAATGANVVVRSRFKGTHDGMGRLPVNGGLLVDVPPTGKRMDVQHIHWYVMKDGLIAEHWANRDDVAMMQQLGLLPETKFDPARWQAAMAKL